MNIVADSRASQEPADADLPWELERRLVRFIHRYVQCLDDNRIEGWPAFFTEDGVYKVYPRENLEAGLPACLLYFDSRATMRDRVLCLKEVSLFANNATRHFLGPSAIGVESDGVYTISTNVLVVHSDVDGNSKIFCAGEYRDRIVERAGEFSFREKTVVLDTFTIPSHLAMPI